MTHQVFFIVRHLIKYHPTLHYKAQIFFNDAVNLSIDTLVSKNYNFLSSAIKQNYTISIIYSFLKLLNWHTVGCFSNLAGQNYFCYLLDRQHDYWLICGKIKTI